MQAVAGFPVGQDHTAARREIDRGYFLPACEVMYLIAKFKLRRGASRLGDVWKEIPQESVAYLGRLCRNNPPMTIRDPRASSILDIMEGMLESGLLDPGKTCSERWRCS